MGDAGIHRDHQIEAGDQRGRRDEIGQMLAHVHNVAALAKRNLVLIARVLLQADEGRIEIQDRRQRVERHRAIVIILVIRIAGPYEADAKAIVPPEPASPLLQPSLRNGGQIGERRRNRIQPRAKRQRQAGQRAMHIELRHRGGAPRKIPPDARHSRNQGMDRTGSFEHHPSAERRHHRCVTHIVDHIAKSLVGVQQDGLALNGAVAEPKRPVEFALGQDPRLPAGFATGPAGFEIAGQQLVHRQIPACQRIVRIQRQRPVVEPECLLEVVLLGEHECLVGCLLYTSRCV